MSAQQNQLTMSLLNNLLQMQGLENTIVNQQQQQQSTTSSTTTSTTASTTSPNSSSPASTSTSQQQQQQQPTSPTNASYNPQLLLEQQIKLTQLQQLQQLQNQIFQQQIALISGQSPRLVPLTNVVDSTRGQNPSGDQHLFTGLPTPGPSGEIRPQNPEVDYMSPISLANYMEPLPRALISSPTSSASSLSSISQSQNQNQVQRTHSGHGFTTNAQRQFSSQGQEQGRITTPTSPVPSGFHHHHQQQQQQQVQYTHPPSPPSPIIYQSSQDHHIHTPSPSIYSASAAMSPNTFGSSRRDTKQSQQGQGQPQYTPTNGNNNNSSSNFNLTHYQHRLHATQQQQHNRTPVITNTFSAPGFSAGPHSAPEKIAFNIYTGPFPSTGSGAAHPSLTSPSTVSVSGATYTNSGGSNPTSKSWKPYNNATTASSSSSSSSSSSPPLPILDQDISPLTSPWLGARPTSEFSYGAGAGAGGSGSSVSRNGGAGSPVLMNANPASSSPSLPTTASSTTTLTKSNKRSASASDDEGLNPRKKQSPAIRPTLGMTGLSNVGGVRGVDTRERDRAAAAAERPKMDKSATPTPPLSASTAFSDDMMLGSGSPGEVPIQGGDRDWDSMRDGEESIGGKDAASTCTSTSTATSAPSRRPAYKGSKSTTSTPLLRSMSTAGGGFISFAETRNRSGSGSNSNSGSNTPNPNPDSGSGSTNTGTGTGTARTKSRTPRGGGGGGGRDDSPSSPVDTSMPPPPVPNPNGSTREMSTMSGMNMDVDIGFGMGIGIGMDMDMNGMGMDMSSMGMGMGNMGMDMGMMGMDLVMGFIDDIDFNEQRQQSNTAPLVPVTPASIMNLGRLGVRPHPTPTPTPPTRQTRRKEPTTVGVSTRSNARSSRKNAASTLTSPNLKPLLPAGSVPPNLDSGLSSPMIFSPSTSASAPNTPRTLLPTPTVAKLSVNHHNNASQQQPIHVRKTSHKAAEQKRRDSLKTTFDDLRKLLPPILLPNDSSSPSLGPSTPHLSSLSHPSHSSSTSSGPSHSPIFLATTPLLPGSLPPRGPPKAGGEGPNKGVSKLQLLICGNEFIRVLKARVERRDEEIERLRREVGRLRSLIGGGGGVGAAGDIGKAEAEAMGIGGMSATLPPSTMTRTDEDREGESGALNEEDSDDEGLDLERDLDAIERIPPRGGGGLGSVYLKSNGNGPSPTGGGGGDDQMDEGDDEGED